MQETSEPLRFETLLADLAARFINLPADQVDLEIEAAQRRVCECLGLDAATLWQWEPDSPKTLVLTHYCLPPGSPPVPERMTASEHFPWSLRETMAGRSFLVDSLDRIPAGAERDAETWRYFGLKNVVTFPLSARGNAPFGAVSFHDMVTPRTWAEHLVKRLEVVSQVFANALMRKGADRALRESEERLNLVLVAAGAGAWIMDIRSNTVWVSARERELFGFGANEAVTYDHFLRVIHPDDREGVRAAVEKTLRTNSPFVVEYRITRPDGGERWISARGQLIGTAETGPGRLMGVSTDITERKRVEEDLRENESRLAAAIDVADLGFYEVTDGDRVTFVDSRAHAIVGHSSIQHQNDTIFQFWAEHLHPDDGPRILDMHHRVNDGTEDRVTVDYRYQHPQRGLIWIHHLVHVMDRDAAGRATRTIGVFQDITKSKQAEHELGLQGLQLAHVARVAAMGQLTSSLAHELNQPLGAILRNAEAAEMLLQDSSPDFAEVRAILGDIRKDDQRAGGVIDRMRDLMKRREVRMAPLDAGRLAAEVITLVRPEADRRRVRLTLATDPVLPPILGDRVQLQQVLLNLLLNAMDALCEKFMDDRHVTVRVRAGAAAVEVSVRDNGPGIPADIFPRVFEPFYTSKPNGLGMGLSISKGIVDAHGGRLWPENKAEGGAVFTFTLPLAGEEGARGEGRGTEERGEGRGAKEEGRGTGDEGRKKREETAS